MLFCVVGFVVGWNVKNKSGFRVSAVIYVLFFFLINFRKGDGFEVGIVLG